MLCVTLFRRLVVCFLWKPKYVSAYAFFRKKMEGCLSWNVSRMSLTRVINRLTLQLMSKREIIIQKHIHNLKSNKIFPFPRSKSALKRSTSLSIINHYRTPKKENLLSYETTLFSVKNLNIEYTYSKRMVFIFLKSFE